MTEKTLPPDPSQSDAEIALLAQRTMALWQNEIARLATDPVVARLASLALEATLRSTASFSGQPSTGTADEQPTPSAAPGTPPAPSSSGDGGMDFRRLQERVDALERRLAALEGEASPDLKHNSRQPESTPGS